MVYGNMNPNFSIILFITDRNILTLENYNQLLYKTVLNIKLIDNSTSVLWIYMYTVHDLYSSLFYLLLQYIYTQFSILPYSEGSGTA